MTATVGLLPTGRSDGEEWPNHHSYVVNRITHDMVEGHDWVGVAGELAAEQPGNPEDVCAICLDKEERDLETPGKHFCVKCSKDLAWRLRMIIAMACDPSERTAQDRRGGDRRLLLVQVTDASGHIVGSGELDLTELHRYHRREERLYDSVMSAKAALLRASEAAATSPAADQERIGFFRYVLNWRRRG